MKKWSFEQKHMDTRVTITLYSSREEKEVTADVKKAFSVFEKLENQFSIFRRNSELTRLNQQAGEQITITPLLFETLEYAMKIARKSKGVFSPFQPRSKTALDLNSIVKGLAIDLALEYFGDSENIMIEAGGDIKVQGLPPKSGNWSIGIRNPVFPQKIMTVVHIRDCAICTSGEYFRKAHLLNPLAKKTKSDNTSISSVTVIAPTAREADALSTAAYFMNINEAIPFVEKHDSAAYLMIDSANNVYAGPRMKSYFKTT